ncbi:MAG: vancomycin resistance protein VanW [Flammeovirgaceae bacterium]
MAEVSQPVKQTEFSANKLENIQTALKTINCLAIYPNQVFSFWKLIGNPTEENGFKLGRSIVGDRLSADFGGGLCQLSGMLYLLTLKTGLEVTERHAHSHDLYNEQTRYTPLGSDATVAYGHKDLRFRNTTEGIIYFHFHYSDNQIIGKVFANKTIPVFELSFETELTETAKIARSYQIQPNREPKLLAETQYNYYEYEVQGL